MAGWSLLLEHGRHADVLRLARQLEQTFRAQGAPEKALEAVQSPRDETFAQIERGVDVDPPLVDDLLRWIHRTRAAGQRRADPQDRRRLAEAAAGELTDALEDLFDATSSWIAARRAGGT